MTDGDTQHEQGWDRGWSEHKVRQLVRLARLPFSEKLDWLESAHRLAEAIRQAESREGVERSASCEARKT